MYEDMGFVDRQYRIGVRTRLRGLLAAFAATHGMACLAEAAPTQAPPAKALAVVPRAQPAGTRHPLEITGGSFRWGWVAGCQAREDSNGDGETDILGGDRVEEYLWASDGSEQPIGEFLRQSPNGRYVAYLKLGHLYVFDSNTNQTLDLSELGAAIADEHEPDLPRPLIAFSSGNWAMFLRQYDASAQLVAIQLETRELRALYETQSAVSGIWYDANEHQLILGQSRLDDKTRKQLRLLQQGKKAPWLRCHLRYPGRPREATERISIPISGLQDREEEEEHLSIGADCLADARFVDVKSSLGGYLVSSRLSNDALSHLGPVQWVRSFERPNDNNCAPALRANSRPLWHEPPEFSFGFSAIGGLWHSNPESLNRTLSSRGYSSTGRNHVVLGGEMLVSYYRLRGTLGLYSVNSKDVTSLYAPHSRATVSGLGFGLSAAFSILRTNRLSLMPEVGIKGVDTAIDFSRLAPPIPLGNNDLLSKQSGIARTSTLLDAALRFEVRAIKLHSEGKRQFYLTLGSYVGWEQQVSDGTWRATDSDGKSLGNFTGPKVSYTGPIMLMYAHVHIDVFGR